jgi:CSLREA domain-containing protein
MKRVVLILTALIAMGGGAHGATFNVNTTADGADAVINGVCATAGGQCSLRAAVQEANAAADDDTIEVPAGTYLLSVADDPFSSPDLDLTNPVTIHGAGPSTIVDGQNNSGVFEVTASATISGLTIRGGNEFSGGGIYAVPDTTLTLTVRDVQLTDNRATHGGAVFVDGGAVVLLERVSMTGNTGVTSGAAIEVSLENGGGTVTVRNATISGNVGQKRVVNEDQLVFDHVTLVGDGITTTGTTTLGGSILDAGAGGTVCDGAVTSAGTTSSTARRARSRCPATRAESIRCSARCRTTAAARSRTRSRTASPPSTRRVRAGSPKTSAARRGLSMAISTRWPHATSAPTSSTPAPRRRRARRRPPRPAVGATTSTTLPGCPTGTTFEAARCRLAELRTDVGRAGTAGGFHDALVTALGKAGDKLTAAESAAGSSAKSGVKKAKKLLKKSAALVKKVSAKLGSKKGQKTFTDAAERSALKSDADAVRNLILALAGSLG